MKYLTVIFLSFLFYQTHCLAMTKIAIIHFFEKGNFWPDGIEAGFTRELKASKITFENKTLYWGKDGGEKGIFSQLDAFKPDLVFLTDDSIASTLMPELMNKKIPTFFTGVNKNPEDLEWIKPEWSNWQTGVVEYSRTRESVQVLKKFKSIRSIGILRGPSQAAKNLSLFIKNDIHKWYPEIAVDIREEEFKDLWLKALRELTTKHDALWPLLPFHVKNSDGSLADWEEIGNGMRQIITVPTVGIGSLKGPIDRLLSFSIPPEELGRQTAVKVFLYLKGRSIYSLPVEPFRLHDFQIKNRELKRLQLNLPHELFGFARMVD